MIAELLLSGCFIIFILLVLIPCKKFINSILDKRLKAVLTELDKAKDLRISAEKMLKESEIEKSSLNKRLNDIRNENNALLAREIEIIKAKAKSAMNNKQIQTDKVIKNFEFEAKKNVRDYTSNLLFSLLNEIAVKNLNNKKHEMIMNNAFKQIITSTDSELNLVRRRK